MASEDRISKIVDKLNQRFQKSQKKDSDYQLIKKASDNMESLMPQYLSTGIMEVDDILGGGLVKGSMVLLAGSPGVGKSCLSYCLAKEVTSAGGVVLYFNLEPPFPAQVAFEDIGVDPSKFFIIDPQEYAELGVDGLESLLYDPTEGKTLGVVDLIIIDSINNLVGKKEVDKLIKEGAEGNNMAVRAQVISNLLQRLQGLGMLRDGTIVVLIAQMRANMDGGTNGPKEKIGAPASALFNPKCILQLSKGKPITRKVGLFEQEVGHTVRVRVKKNNLTGKLGTCEYSVIDRKVDDSGRLSQLGQELGYIVTDTDAGRAIYRFLLGSVGVSDVRVKGKPMLETALRKNPELAANLRKILKQGKPKTVPVFGENVETYDPAADVEEVTEEG